MSTTAVNVSFTMTGMSLSGTEVNPELSAASFTLIEALVAANGASLGSNTSNSAR